MASLYIAPKSVYMLGYELAKKLAEEHCVRVQLSIQHRDGTTCTLIFDKRDTASQELKEKP